MHVAKTFDLLEDTNIVSNLTSDEFKIFRKLVIRFVLDTDL